MDRRVTIKVSGRTYALKAKDDQMEEVLREAVKVVNKKIDAFKANWPEKTEEDILTFIALNACAGEISLKKKLNEIEAEASGLLSEISGYIEKNKA